MKIVVAAGVFKFVWTCKKLGAFVTGCRFCGAGDRASECAPVCDLNRGSELIARLGKAEAGIMVVVKILCQQVPGKKDPEQTAEDDMRSSSRCV